MTNPAVCFTEEDVDLAGRLADQINSADPGLLLQFLPLAVRERETRSELYRAFHAQQSLPSVLAETAQFCREIMRDTAGQVRYMVQYDEATVTSREKERLWGQMGLEEAIRAEMAHVKVDMIKSVLFHYNS